MNNYKITKFYSFSDFKRKVGSNNHLLITALIGIHKVNKDDRKLEEANHPFSWNPEDITASINRTDEFARKASLVWIVDCFDSLLSDFVCDFYRDNTTELNELIKESGLKDLQRDYSYNEFQRSVYLKFIAISTLLKKETNLDSFRQKNDSRLSSSGQIYFPNIELIVAACDFAIQWRNNLVHFSANNDASNDSKRILKKFRDILGSKEYCSLDAERFKKDFSNNQIPSFKETAFMIRSLIDYGFCINAYWIEKVDREKVLTNTLDELFKDDKFCLFWKKMKARCADRKKKYLITSIKQRGIHLEKIEADQTSDLNKIIEDYALRDL